MGDLKLERPSSSSSSFGVGDEDEDDKLVSDIREKHRLDLENLTLTTQPLKTLYLFIMATSSYLQKSLLYVLKRGGWFFTLSILFVALGFLLLAVDGPHEKHVQEFLHYFRFGLWWVGLGVASSIGLGSGLHTFVMYLGPHIALFTIKAVQCGRVDLKAAPYDTIQLNRDPSWLEKECSNFGSPIFSPLPDSSVTVPLSSILPQIQLEAILWGVGTAIGELPPYFISRAASMSGRKVNVMDEFDDDSSQNEGIISDFLTQTKYWLLTHSQHLNFLTILLLASVPNPLFDLAGIMCGQFGIPFWKFFLATLTGKAIIKTHLQTIFIITLCNNQLLELVENELIWMLGHIPFFSTKCSKLIPKLHTVKEKFLTAPVADRSGAKDKQWTLSFNLIWTTVVWLMIIHFFVKIVTSTAQEQLKKQQDMELTKTLSGLRNSCESNCVADDK